MRRESLKDLLEVIGSAATTGTLILVGVETRIGAGLW
jgi:hypothetical protein